MAAEVMKQHIALPLHLTSIPELKSIYLQVQLPIHDPHTVLLLNLFQDQHRRNTGRLRSSPPRLVGKLRLRVNTLSPGLQYESDLPLLADRKEGGSHTGTVSLQAKASLKSAPSSQACPHVLRAFLP